MVHPRGSLRLRVLYPDQGTTGCRTLWQCRTLNTDFSGSCVLSFQRLLCVCRIHQDFLIIISVGLVTRDTVGVHRPDFLEWRCMNSLQPGLAADCSTTRSMPVVPWSWILRCPSLQAVEKQHRAILPAVLFEVGTPAFRSRGRKHYRLKDLSANCILT
jgi:hypothetical protein